MWCAWRFPQVVAARVTVEVTVAVTEEDESERVFVHLPAVPGGALASEGAVGQYIAGARLKVGEWWAQRRAAGRVVVAALDSLDELKDCM